MSDEAPERTSPFITNSMGKGDKGARPKAKAAHERATEMGRAVEIDSWPRGANGNPMMKISMVASELIPTGQYANVSVGPAQITCFIDPERGLGEGETYFSDGQRAVIAQSLNELAEIVEGDVVAVQRNLVMASMQDQIGK